VDPYRPKKALQQIFTFDDRYMWLKNGHAKMWGSCASRTFHEPFQPVHTGRITALLASPLQGSRGVGYDDGIKVGKLGALPVNAYAGPR
jgi:hypothetical protein